MSVVVVWLAVLTLLAWLNHSAIESRVHNVMEYRRETNAVLRKLEGIIDFHRPYLIVHPKQVPLPYNLTWLSIERTDSTFKEARRRELITTPDERQGLEEVLLRGTTAAAQQQLQLIAHKRGAEMVLMLERDSKQLLAAVQHKLCRRFICEFAQQSNVNMMAIRLATARRE